MINELIERYPALNICRDDIELAVNEIINCYKNGGKLLLCGNGGSSSDCDHIVGELMKGFLEKRELTGGLKEELGEEFSSHLQGSLPAISLSSFTGLNSAFANDVDPDFVYAQSVLGLGKKDDVLIAISTSGNSRNVVNAVKVARALGMKTVSMTGESGGKLREMTDICISVPESETFKVQELHLPVYHAICALVEKHFFG